MVDTSLQDISFLYSKKLLIIYPLIPLFLIKTKFKENFEFHSTVDIIKCSLNNFSCFYKEILWWSKYLSFPISLPSTITSQFFSLNKYIKVDTKKLCRTII